MTSHRHSADGSSVSVSVTADAQSPAQYLPPCSQRHPGRAGCDIVLALDLELVWLAHEHEPWRPRTGESLPDTET